MNYKKLSEKLSTKLEDIFEPIVKTKVWMNEIATLCDIRSSVSTIPKSLFDRLNLGSFTTTEPKTSSRWFYIQKSFIKENIVVQRKKLFFFA
jgi:hypothetical protein